MTRPTSTTFSPQSFTGRSVADHVADALRVAIGEGAFGPGEPLNQVQLAEQFRVSHNPVREAIRRLEAEGLVRVIPNRGAFVAELSADEVEELYDIRIPLELRALRTQPTPRAETHETLEYLFTFFPEARATLFLFSVGNGRRQPGSHRVFVWTSRPEIEE